MGPNYMQARHGVALGQSRDALAASHDASIAPTAKRSPPLRTRRRRNPSVRGDRGNGGRTRAPGSGTRAGQVDGAESRRAQQEPPHGRGQLKRMGGNQDLVGFDPRTELSATSIALHLPGLFSGLLPPFGEFFDVMLTHYHIHALHLDPRSVLLLSSFAFMCEAFLGILPSMALPRHFLSLQLTAPDPRSGCVSLQAADTTAGECIDMEINHFAEGFTRQWVFVDAEQYNPCC
ncbi:hypothetical protein D1007_52239 [Hordeum vulgare]|nr:hypothetical protein D1007_52239 [Hordeum vulgare]